MAVATVPFRRVVRNLFPTIPDTVLSRLIQEGYSLANIEPKILGLIDRDRDAAALVKKAQRVEDLDWLKAHGQRPLAFSTADEVPVDERELETGRPRMPGHAVLLFMLLRGTRAGLQGNKTWTLSQE